MIIGISGKKQHGKDTVCKIIQYLSYPKNSLLPAFNLKHDYEASGWQRKLFADKLKDMVCMLISCTREQLEDNTFKETPLDGWDCYIVFDTLSAYPILYPIDSDIEWLARGRPYRIRPMTPRMMLQLLGTDCGRNIIHPNVWVNALMSEYKEPELGNLTINPNTWQEHEVMQTGSYPNWIITDVRFPNEAKAIKDRGGLVIRVNNSRIISTDEHQSETALDNYKDWDRTIENHTTIENLVYEIKVFLQYRKII